MPGFGGDFLATWLTPGFGGALSATLILEESWKIWLAPGSLDEPCRLLDLHPALTAPCQLI